MQASPSHRSFKKYFIDLKLVKKDETNKASTSNAASSSAGPSSSRSKDKQKETQPARNENDSKAPGTRKRKQNDFDEDDHYIRTLTSILSIAYGDRRLPNNDQLQLEIDTSGRPTVRTDKELLKYARKMALMVVRVNEICTISPRRLKEGLVGLLYQEATEKGTRKGREIPWELEDGQEGLSKEFEPKDDDQKDMSDGWKGNLTLTEKGKPQPGTLFVVCQNSTTNDASYKPTAKIEYTNQNVSFDDELDRKAIQQFILDNWNLPFSHHLKVVEHLLNVVYKTPSDSDLEKPFNRLLLYLNTESCGKSHRRFLRCRPEPTITSPHFLDILQQCFNSKPEASVDKTAYLESLLTDQEISLLVKIGQYASRYKQAFKSNLMNLFNNLKLNDRLKNDEQAKLDDSETTILDQNLGTIYTRLVLEARLLTDQLAYVRYGMGGPKDDRNQDPPKPPSMKDDITSFRKITIQAMELFDLLRRVAWDSKLFLQFMLHNADHLQEAEFKCLEGVHDKSPASLVGDEDDTVGIERDLDIEEEEQSLEGRDDLAAKIIKWIRLCVVQPKSAADFRDLLRRGDTQKLNCSRIVRFDYLEGPAPQSPHSMMDTEVVLEELLSHFETFVTFENASDVLREVAEKKHQKDMFPAPNASTKKNSIFRGKKKALFTTSKLDRHVFNKDYFPALRSQKTKQSQHFRGARHSKAVITTLQAIAIKLLNGQELDKKETAFVAGIVLEDLSYAPLIFGVSKRCCYSCVILISLIAAEIIPILEHQHDVAINKGATLSTTRTPFACLDTHGKIYPYCIPQGLSNEVRKKFINHLEQVLHNWLRIELRKRERDERERLETSPTLDSVALSTTDESAIPTVAEKDLWDLDDVDFEEEAETWI